ncbi:MAG: hypothetical protein RR565_08025 [Erysipelothrix sp.]
MKKLTKREEVLLLILALIIIVLGGVMFLINPLKNDIAAIEMEMDDLRNTEMEMQIAVPNIKKTRENHQNVKNEVIDALDKISDPVQPETYDLQIRHYATETNLKINKLIFQDGTLADIKNKNTKEKEPSQLQENIDRINGEPIHTDKENESSDGNSDNKQELWIYTLTVEVTGNSNDIVDFISGIQESMPRIYLQSLSLDTQRNSGIINFSVYSLDKIKTE